MLDMEKKKKTIQQWLNKLYQINVEIQVVRNYLWKLEEKNLTQSGSLKYGKNFVSPQYYKEQRNIKYLNFLMSFPSFFFFFFS